MRKPKVLMVILPYLVKDININMSKTRSFLAFPYGVLSIVKYCETIGWFRILDLNLYSSPEEKLYNTVKEFEPDVVGFSMMFDNSYYWLNSLSTLVNDYNYWSDHDLIQVLGGAAASYGLDEILREQEYIDGICFGEGEIPFFSLLVNLSNGKQSMFNQQSWISKWKSRTTPIATFIKDLDDVIDLDYSYVNINDYSMDQAFSPFVVRKDKVKQFFLVTSRGCPFNCVFCNNSAIHGKKVRTASVDKIVDHVERLVNLGMEVLTIYDDQLLMDVDRAKELFRRLERFHLRIECPNGLSIAYIDAELAYLMRRAGMDTAYLAIESGSDRVLKEVIHKPLKLSQVAPAVQILRENNFYIHGFFVIGCPGETKEDRDETREFVKSIGLDWAGFNAATPVRGSKLYEICKENNYIPTQKISEIVDKKYIIRTPDWEPEDIEEEIYLMNLDCNFVNNYRMKVGDWSTAAKAFRDVIKRYGNHAFAFYYLGECYRHMGDEETALYLKQKFNYLCKQDLRWMEYAKYFGLVD
jgi:radical SAM superfamily enzyme YgiQ (UPF0313 family)